MFRSTRFCSRLSKLKELEDHLSCYLKTQIEEIRESQYQRSPMLLQHRPVLWVEQFPKAHIDRQAEHSLQSLLWMPQHENWKVTLELCPIITRSAQVTDPSQYLDMRSESLPLLWLHNRDSYGASTSFGLSADHLCPNYITEPARFLPQNPLRHTICSV